MKLGLLIGYSGKIIDLEIDRIKRAESLGFDSVWTAEAYGSDAVSPAAWILAQTDKIKVGTAIMQMPGRTPRLYRHDRHDAQSAIKRPFYAWFGCFRTAGC